MSILFAKRPIVINSDLAILIGLNEAIVLQQLHYWLSETNSGIEHEGRRWVYNTLDEWRENSFPFFSRETIKRTFASLKRAGVVMVKKLSQDKHNKTNYYTIIYESPVLTDGVKLTPSKGAKCADGAGHIDPMEQVILTRSMRSNCADVTENTSENTSENKKPSCPDASPSDEKISKADFLTRHPEAVVCSPAKRQWGSQDDLTCAQWIWKRVLKLYEQADTLDGEPVRPKEPNWTAWANDIRLMRMLDGRTHKQICELFRRVQSDPFWIQQVKCPSKLREKWDDLVIRFCTGVNMPARRDVNHISEPDNTIPTGFRG
ncbi:hypothetical protein [Cronobacter dublinensis]|uniref:hypothetical protein n=1 Tax=Cronobacter dublinensis TaxID=413497 RepID=UPI00300DEC82